MPKTSKKSKASKRTGLRKRFDLSNKKVQFFAVIGIVAVLGGGWFTYKSFAATGDYFAAMANGQLQCLGGCQSVSDQIVTNEQKNNVSVALLSKNGGVKTRNDKIIFKPSANYNVCVTAKGTGTISLKHLYYSSSAHIVDVASGLANANQASGRNIGSILVNDSTKYNKLCRSYNTNFFDSGFKLSQIYVWLLNDTSPLVSISELSITQVGYGTNSSSK